MSAFSKSAFTFVAFVTLAKLTTGAFIAPRAGAPFRIYLGTNTDTFEQFAMSGDSTSPDCDTGLVSISAPGANASLNYCGSGPFALDGSANLTVTSRSWCHELNDPIFIAELANYEQTHRCGEYDGPANGCGVDWQYTCSKGASN